MHMNRWEHDLWLVSIRTVCPYCTNECPGAENCVTLAEWIVKKKEEIRKEHGRQIV